MAREGDADRARFDLATLPHERATVSGEPLSFRKCCGVTPLLLCRLSSNRVTRRRAGSFIFT